MEGVLHRPEKSDILNPESISNFLGKGENGMEHLYEKALESAEYIKMQQHAYAPECDRLLNLSPHPVPDANYYVFGLRKIII